MILVLGAAELLLLFTVELLLPDNAECVLLLLPDSPAIVELDLFAELVRYEPVLLPDRLLVKLL